MDYKLTLQEWVARTGIQPTHPTTERGVVSVVCVPHQNPLLWFLSDYAVSSVCGSVIWLVPRRASDQL